MGGRSGAGGIESDALAIIHASQRFGELDEEDQEERTRIADALAIHAQLPSRQIGEYDFYGVITGQSTTATGQIKLSVTVPWECREDIWQALETMPFKAQFRMRELPGG